MMLTNILISFISWIHIINALDSKILCENTQGQIDCGIYYHIQVVDATYGRTSSSVCPHSTVFVSNTFNCIISTLSTVSSFCDFKQTCSLSATNGIDPCPNVYKYLNVSYDCLNMDTTYIYTYKTTDNKHTTGLTLTTAAEVTPSNDRPCTCACTAVGNNKWGFLESLNLTQEEIKTIMKIDLDELAENMRINPKNTTKYLRTITSAADDRKSSASIGYVGIIFILIIIGSIMLIDLLGCRRRKDVFSSEQFNTQMSQK